MLIFISVEVHTDPRSVEVREGPSYDIEVDLKTSTGAVGLFFQQRCQRRIGEGASRRTCTLCPIVTHTKMVRQL